jgi:hypothetical protein
MAHEVTRFLAAPNHRIFVIGPIGERDSTMRKRSDNILDILIRPAAKACDFEEAEVRRADDLAEPGSIPDQVVQRLLEDELVIADLHDHNPNVFYELAIRHTTGKPCLLIAAKTDRLPFDVHGQRVIFLDQTDVRTWEEAREELIRQIKFLQQKTLEPPETMVTMAFELLKLRRNQGLLDVFAMMERTRPARKICRDARDNGKTWRDLNSTQLAAVDDLCRSFDLLGVYDKLGIVNSLHVDYMYAVPFVDLYETFLKDYVEYLQNGPRGPMHFWELVQFYRRVRNVPRNHPAATGAPDWPQDPRGRPGRPRVKKRATGSRRAVASKTRKRDGRG